MAITIQCPNPACATSSAVPETITGRQVKCKRCGTPFKAVPTLDGRESETKKSTPSTHAEPFPNLPAEFGRYRVLKKLGQGGMGAVYLAQDSQLSRQVALKLPNFEAGDTQRMDRFVREARAAAGLMHPHICPVYDAGQIQDRAFIAMGYIDGNPLEDLIDPDLPMPEGEAVSLVRKIASALKEAHDKGIVHRDLKPANVMVNARGEPVVMDFGLAKKFNEIDPNEAKLTRDGAVMGTPSYMAPEQARGDQKEIGPATDVYALGVILFEMLTGHTPYNGPLAVVLGQILTAPVPPLGEYRKDLHPKLEGICQKAMAKDPKARYPDMVSFSKALDDLEKAPKVEAEKARKPEPAPAPIVFFDEVVAPEKGTKKPTTKPVAPKMVGMPPRTPLLIGGGVAGFLFFVAGIWGIFFTVRTSHGDVVIELSDPAAQVDVRVDGETVRIEGVEKPLSLKAGEHGLTVTGADFETVTRDFTVKKGEKQVLRVTLKPKAEAKEVAQAPGSPPPLTIPVPGGPAAGPGKPPGNPVAATTSPLDSLDQNAIPDNELNFYGGRENAPPELVGIHPIHFRGTDIHGFTLSPDGERVAIARYPTRKVEIFDIRTGNLVGEFGTPPPQPFVYWLKYSKDGKNLMGIQIENNLHCWELSGREIWREKVKTDWSIPALSPDGSMLATGMPDRSLLLLDPKTGGRIRSWEGSVRGGPSRLAFSHDGSLLGILMGSTVHVVKSSTNEQKHSFEVFALGGSIGFGYNQTIYVAHSWMIPEHHVSEINMTTGRIRDYRMPGMGCSQPVAHPGAPLLVTSSKTRLQLWDTEAGPEARPLLMEMGGDVHKYEFTPDGKHLVVGTTEGLRVIRIPQGETISQWLARRTGRPVGEGAKAPPVNPMAPAPVVTAPNNPPGSPPGTPPMVAGAGSARPTVPPNAPVPDPNAGFVPMFNGRDLTGWRAHGAPIWRWANGELVGIPGAQGGPGYLMTEREYANFELTLEAKLAPGAGSGIFLRGKALGDYSGRGQMEIQLMDDNFPKFTREQFKTGSVYGLIPCMGKPTVRAGQWINMRIRLDKRKIQVTVNGVQTVNQDLDSAAARFNGNPGFTRESGSIGLQVNQLAGLEFRNVRIKNLD